MDERTAKALTRFKVMAFAVGVGLLILCAEIVLHYAFDNESLAWWSPVHGVLYMLYLVTVVDLGTKVGWTVPHMVKVALAGVVPLLSFVVERQVERGVRGQHGPADTLAG